MIVIGVVIYFIATSGDKKTTEIQPQQTSNAESYTATLPSPVLTEAGSNSGAVQPEPSQQTRTIDAPSETVNPSPVPTPAPTTSETLAEPSPHANTNPYAAPSTGTQIERAPVPLLTPQQQAPQSNKFWKFISTPRVDYLWIDLGYGRIAQVSVTPDFRKLDAAKMDYHAESVKNYILKSWATPGGNYMYLRDGRVLKVN